MWSPAGVHPVECYCYKRNDEPYVYLVSLHGGLVFIVLLHCDIGLGYNDSSCLSGDALTCAERRCSFVFL